MKRLLVVILILFSIMAFTACDSKSAGEAFDTYKDKWQEKDYEAMYDMLSKESKEYISKEDFIDRHNNIYSGINAENIKINLADDSKNAKNIKFNIKMDTLAGNIEIKDYEASMVKEKKDDEDKWLVNWDESLIFPEMSKNDKVRVDVLSAKRGEIYDSSGNGLAINDIRYNVGIYPELFEEDKEKNISKLAEILDIDEEKIIQALEQNINPEFFVPIVKIARDDDRVSELLGIDGVKTQEVDARVYPGGEAFGSLIGYISPITKEQLDEDKEGIYTNKSMVGKLGLETVYEESLRAKNGAEIYISKMEEGEEVDKLILAKTRPEDGKDLKLSVDSDLQKKIYEEMKEDVGASSAINPKTGKVLALVSSPSFDSNLFSTYFSNSDMKRMDEKEADAFQNRFNDAYSPGSTFKLVTGAIGLETGAIEPEEKLSIQGKTWKKDSSWGDYSVSRVSTKLSNVDLNDAFVYSDNIYFARTALEIGEEDFLEEAKKFGFGEELPFKYPMQDSQIANEGNIDGEILLANTGYGQGQVLTNPLHLALIYSSIVNDGNIMEPILESKEDEDTKIWKEKVISDDNKEILLDNLIDVVENQNGTGHEAKLEGIRLAGKTGTAELKSSKDEKGKENGWFVAMNVDEPEILVSMVIENVEDRGGSHYTVPKVRNVIEDYLKR